MTDKLQENFNSNTGTQIHCPFEVFEVRTNEV